MSKKQNQPLSPVLTDVKASVLNSYILGFHLDRYNVYFLNTT